MSGYNGNGDQVSPEDVRLMRDLMEENHRLRRECKNLSKMRAALRAEAKAASSKADRASIRARIKELDHAYRERRTIWRGITSAKIAEKFGVSPSYPSQLATYRYRREVT